MCCQISEELPSVKFHESFVVWFVIVSCIIWEIGAEKLIQILNMFLKLL